MDQGFRRGFTTAEKTELWDRWQRGESLKAIGRAFGKPSSSIYFQVSPHGGIRPAQRRRSRLALTLSEREETSRGIAVRREDLVRRADVHVTVLVEREVLPTKGSVSLRALAELAAELSERPAIRHADSRHLQSQHRTDCKTGVHFCRTP